MLLAVFAVFILLWQELSRAASPPRGTSRLVISPEIDAELARLHAVLEEDWLLAESATKQLGDWGRGVATDLRGLGSALASVAIGGEGTLPAAAKASSLTPPSVSGEKLEVLNGLRSEFQQLQQVAFQIGHESSDNEALSQHPKLNEYVNSLRSFQPRLRAVVNDLEDELKSRGGLGLGEKTKKGKKRAKSKGLVEESIRIHVRSRLAQDDRPFRTQALDAIGIFRERQLEMQDKQGDMKRSMDGPDWPKEDWPLTSSDAKAIGEAETTIQSAKEVLEQLLERVGGLARAPETEDWSTLEQLVVLSEMMQLYGEMIDKHVDSIKRVQRSKKKQASTTGRGTRPSAPPAIGLGFGADTRLRSSLGVGGTASTSDSFPSGDSALGASSFGLGDFSASVGAGGGGRRGLNSITGFGIQSGAFSSSGGSVGGAFSAPIPPLREAIGASVLAANAGSPSFGRSAQPFGWLHEQGGGGGGSPFGHPAAFVGRGHGVDL